MSISARKITPFHVVDDIDAADEAFAALGFEPMRSEDCASCTGWKADNGTAVVVAARQLVAQEFGEAIAQKIANRSVSYVLVESLPDALEEVGEQATVLARTLTSYGTAEAIVETAAGLMIIAERIE